MPYSAPWDLIKTRIQNDAKGEYKGIVDCFVKTLRHEGAMGLYKGWLALYLPGPTAVDSTPTLSTKLESVGLLQ